MPKVSKTSTSTILSLAIVLVIIITVSTVYISHTVYASHESTHLLMSAQDARHARFGMIIDVRTPKEREHLGYYPNSIPLDLDTLRHRIGALTSKATTILVYSNGDNKAKLAAELLYSMKFHGVRYIATTYLSLLPGSQ